MCVIQNSIDLDLNKKQQFKKSDEVYDLLLSLVPCFFNALVLTTMVHNKKTKGKPNLYSGFGKGLDGLSLAI